MDRKAAGSLPFVGAMTDSVEFMRRLWGASGLPGLPTASGLAQFAQGLPQALPSMITPTLDVEELDKRIADLRAVEQWLALNANMLRATIQSLEVQRNTIATLKSFSGSMLSTMRGGPLPAGTPAPMAVNPYLVGKTAAAAPVPSPAPAAAAPRAKAPPRSRARRKPAAAAGSMPLNPALWWGALHDQFTKVAAAAASAAAEPAAGARPPVNRGSATTAAAGRVGTGGAADSASPRRQARARKRSGGTSAA